MAVTVRYHGGLFEYAGLDRLRPHLVVGGLAMGLDGGLVAIDLVEEEAIRGGAVLDHVEAQSPRLVIARTARVLLGGDAAHSA